MKDRQTELLHVIFMYSGQYVKFMLPPYLIQLEHYDRQTECVNV